jgi:hypothetical protein
MGWRPETYFDSFKITYQLRNRQLALVQDGKVVELLMWTRNRHSRMWSQRVPDLERKPMEAPGVAYGSFSSIFAAPKADPKGTPERNWLLRSTLPVFWPMRRHRSMENRDQTFDGVTLDEISRKCRVFAGFRDLNTVLG